MTDADGVAPPIPPLAPDAPPLAILVDYDGTIALTDVSDTVMAEHVPGVWEAEVAAYDAGQVGSRRLIELTAKPWAGQIFGWPTKLGWASKWSNLRLQTRKRRSSD